MSFTMSLNQICNMLLIPRNFNAYSHSYAQWRDNKLPTEILSDLCQKSGLPPPVYTQIDNTVKVGGKEFYADTTIIDETGEFVVKAVS